LKSLKLVDAATVDLNVARLNSAEGPVAPIPEAP
jgi:hypothetical protein